MPTSTEKNTAYTIFTELPHPIGTLPTHVVLIVVSILLTIGVTIRCHFRVSRRRRVYGMVVVPQEDHSSITMEPISLRLCETEF